MTENKLTNDQREALDRLAGLILDACAEAWGMIAPRGRMKSKQAIIAALEYFTEPVWRELSQQREDNAELRRYFDLRRDADQRAIARWQKCGYWRSGKGEAGIMQLPEELDQSPGRADGARGENVAGLDEEK